MQALPQPLTCIEALPQAKFKLFQRVAITDHDPATAVITGLEYVSPVVAIAESLHYGWQYTLRSDSGLGKPIEQLVGQNFEAIVVHEDDLGDVLED